MYFFYKRINICDVFSLSLALSLALTLALTMVFVIITMIGCDSSNFSDSSSKLNTPSFASDRSDDAIGMDDSVQEDGDIEIDFAHSGDLGLLDEDGGGYGEGAGSGLDDSSSNAQLDPESRGDDYTEIPSDSLGEPKGILTTHSDYVFTERIITNPTAETRKLLPVDMVIAVDVSGSMRDEIGQVKTNLRGFYDSIGAFTDTKIGVMVKEGATVDGMTFSEILSADIDKHADIVRINQIVIENSLWVLSAFIENKLSAQSSDSKLKKENFFREDSLKYFVVITDEYPYCDWYRAEGDGNGIEGSGICYYYAKITIVSTFKEKLISQFSKWGGIDKIRFVGIVSPTGGARKKYHELITKHPKISGKLYDVTAANWYSHFTDLSEEIIIAATVGVRYRLGKLALHVSSVTIDGGDPLARRSYHLDDDNHIVFANDVLDASKVQNIDITYDTREENHNPGWQ